MMKTTILMTILTLLFIVVGQAIGGASGATTAFLFALVMNCVSYWFSDKIVLAMYRAREVEESDAPELYSIVRVLTTRAGIPLPRIYIIDTPTPNAFATGRDPSHAAVAVTTGIMRLLNREELEGVIGHELAHVKHRDTLIGTIAATIAGAITMLANMARWALIFGGGHRSRDEEEGAGGAAAGIAMIILAPIAALLIQMAISRSREFGADDGGAKISGNPLALASALKKLHQGVQKMPMQANPATAHLFIVNPLSAEGFFTLFSTHPPIEERVRRLEGMAYRR